MKSGFRELGNSSVEGINLVARDRPFSKGLPGERHNVGTPHRRQFAAHQAACWKSITLSAGRSRSTHVNEYRAIRRQLAAGLMIIDLDFLNFSGAGHRGPAGTKNAIHAIAARGGLHYITTGSHPSSSRL
jgi:hypothetical protein